MMFLTNLIYQKTILSNKLQILLFIVSAIVSTLLSVPSFSFLLAKCVFSGQQEITEILEQLVSNLPKLFLARLNIKIKS